VDQDFMDQPTVLTAAISIVSTVCVLLGGAFGKGLIEKWGDRDAWKAKSAAEARQAASAAEATASKLKFEDNEQARQWLREQLDERDAELRDFRKRERELLERVGGLAEQVARQEERSAAQAAQIQQLQILVEKYGTDYVELKAERDQYRDEKHDAMNQLAPLVLKAGLLEREIAAKNAEIEQLKGQVAAISAASTPERILSKKKGT
jgi:chromosome segregation ATPase